jgi:hypothetical protein
VEAAFLAAVLGEALGAVLLDVLHRPLLAIGVGGRDVDFPAFLVRENTSLRLDSLGLHVGGRCNDRQQMRHLLGHSLRRLLLQPLLLGSARLQLVGRFGL